MHLPQAQKFAPRIFRDGNVLVVTNAALIPDPRAPFLYETEERSGGSGDSQLTIPSWIDAVG